MKTRIFAVGIVLMGLLVGFFVYTTEVHEDSNYPFKLGLDLDGGTHLTYEADTENISADEIDGAMSSLRQTIERRVNLFGVSEPLVQVEQGGLFGNDQNDNRLIVELPGVTDIEEAIALIGRTPLLEFRLQKSDLESAALMESVSEDATPEEVLAVLDQIYLKTGLTGALVKRASLQFGGGNGVGGASVGLEFTSEGAELFKEITGNNIGNVLAIFLDGQPISTPVIRDQIANGQAQISGNFTPEEARQLVQDLNFGALPVPIELIETQTIGASLGDETIVAGVKALLVGFALVSLFLIAWYRLPGIVASLGLGLYAVLMLALFKLIPVTLTASGIAGLILSIGMAVDANVLIFERMKEELDGGSKLAEAVRNGFSRAWPSIRDGNFSSIIAAVVLYWLSDTSLVKGFALVFGLGVLVSMFTAVSVSRTVTLALASEDKGKTALFGSGLKK